MNDQRLETGIKPPEQQHESQPTTPSAQEILGSLELAVDFLQGVPEKERSQSIRELMAQSAGFREKELVALVAEQQSLYTDLISKGIDGYLELRKKIIEDVELSDKEKREKTEHLNSSYRRAQQLRQMVRAKALQELLANLTNPYLQSAEARQAYNYDPGFETATSLVDYDKGEYKSNWDPAVHFSEKLAKFLSEQDIREIRKFLENFFNQQFRVEKKLDSVRQQLNRDIDTEGYDPRAAEIILSEFGILPKGLKLDQYTRVVCGSNTISVILSNDDYGPVRGLDEKKVSSRGVYYPGTVLNCVKAHGEVSGSISHENEHALNDILLGLHRTEIKDDMRFFVASYDARKEYSEQELKDIYQQIIESMVMISSGDTTFMDDFANEVLSFKLGTKEKTNEDILNTLNNEELYLDLNITDNNIPSDLIAAIIAVCIRDIFMPYVRFDSQRGLIAETRDQPDLFSSRITEFLSAKVEMGLDDTVKKILNRDKVFAMRKKVVEQVDRLINANVPPEKIRALLSANNPMLWEEITDRALAKEDILTEDENRLRNLSAIQARETLSHAKRITEFEERQFEAVDKIPDEEKKNFEDITAAISEFTVDGYKIARDGFYKDQNSKGYVCSLRKIKDNNSYNISISQFIEYNPESGKETFWQEATIRVGNNKRTVSKDLRSSDNGQLTADSIKASVREVEEELGV
ncbi:MAG: hypothetical protein WC752_04115 [Patescibacteria group bacterium]|jgi:hypothetical protein